MIEEIVNGSVSRIQELENTLADLLELFDIESDTAFYDDGENRVEVSLEAFEFLLGAEEVLTNDDPYDFEGEE